LLSRSFLILLGLAGALAFRFGPTTFDPWLRLACVPLLLVLLAAVEPVLIVLVAAEVGVRIGARDAWGYGVGIAAAALVVAYALARWRMLPRRIPPVLTMGAVLLAAIPEPLALANAAAAAALAWIGTRILLPRMGSGAPSLRSLLGGAYVFAYGLFLQLGLIWILSRLLRWPVARVRRAGQRGMRGLFHSFPYGRIDLGPIDLSRPAVVVSNHQSSLDIILVLGFPGDVRLTTSPRVWDEPWLGYSARLLGHVRVDENLLESCRAVAAEGASIQFYPEGTRSRDGYPARFRRGAFELAVQLGIDVVPVVICDSRVFVPRDAYWVDWAHMTVKALPRVAPGDDSRALQKRVQGMLREAFAHEMAQINTPEYLRRKVRRLYRYQGWRVLREVTRRLRDAPVPARPAEEPAGEAILIESGGYGVEALLLAECHAGIRIVVRERDPRKLAVARHAAASHPRIKFEPTD